MNDRELARLAHANALNATLIDIHIATALATIEQRLDDKALDGYPSTASGSDSGPQGHGETSSTERATLKRLGDDDRPGISQFRYELEDWISTQQKATRNALRLIDRFSTQRLTRSELDRLRCISCPSFADVTRTDGRCLRCGETEDGRLTTQAAERRLRRHGNRQPAA